jgi:predicted glycosyltransferase involved in capsule biosynthesis
MEESSGKIERRRDKRFTAGENVFAVIKMKKMIICKVANVSKGGLFFYSEELDKIENTSLKVDIYINDKVYIHNVQVSIVSEFITQDEKAFDGFPIRYLNLSFNELNKIQKDRILDIIAKSDPCA